MCLNKELFSAKKRRLRAITFETSEKMREPSLIF